MLIQQLPVPIKEAEDMPCGRGWAPPDLRTCPIAPAVPPLTKSAVRPEVEHRVGFRADSEPKFEAQAEAAPRGARQSGWPARHSTRIRAPQGRVCVCVCVCVCVVSQNGIDVR